MKFIIGIFLFIGLLLAGLTLNRNEASTMSDKQKVNEIVSETAPDGYERAVVAPGCFWCLEATLQETEGFGPVISGYAGGEEFDPTYGDVYTGSTSHREAVMAYYDPNAVTYREVIDLYLKNIDPTDEDGQFYDRGFTYTTAIFYETDAQKADAEAALAAIAPDFNKPIAVKVLPYTTFYEAEEYHQDFYKKAPARYESYSNAKDNLKEVIWQEIQKEQSQS